LSHEVAIRFGSPSREYIRRTANCAVDLSGEPEPQEAVGTNRAVFEHGYRWQVPHLGRAEAAERAGGGAAADEAWGDEDEGLIGPAGVDEGAEDLAAALDEDVGEVAAAEGVEDGGQAEAAPGGGEWEEFAASAGEAASTGGARLGGCDDGGNGAGGADEAG